jgi:hypothetical protein
MNDIRVTPPRSHPEGYAADIVHGYATPNETKLATVYGATRGETIMRATTAGLAFEKALWIFED